MPAEIVLKALAPDMETAGIAAWHKHEGDSVEQGEVIIDLETDKATLEVEAEESGVLGKILVPEGTDDVPVGTLVGLILTAGESASALEGYGPSSLVASEPVAAPLIAADDEAPVRNVPGPLAYDVIVVGGGPAGYVTAIRARQLGFRTALVEREHLGGICLNWGCIPTKALLRSAEVYELMQHADLYGLSAGDVGFDLQKVVARSRSISKQLNSGVAHLLKKNKVDVFMGDASLQGKAKLKISVAGSADQVLSAAHIILATGARSRNLPGLESDGSLVWNYKDAMVPEALPGSILVIGAGAIGIEFASFYNTMGVDVTVVEVLSEILPVEDEEISRFVAASLSKQGITIKNNTVVKELRRHQDSVTAVLDQDGNTTEIEVDRVILAVGVVGNHENLGLENTSIDVERSFIVADEWSRTAEPGVFAIGDVAGAPCLAHKASHEGIICIEKIAAEPGVHALNKTVLPACTYCKPQVASVGLTEREALEQGYSVKVGRFPFQGNGKAIAMGEAEGLIKTLFDEDTGELLGAHLVGTEVTELIQGFGIAQSLETTEQELMQTVFAHPTLSEMMHESVLDAFARVIHY